MTLVFVRKPILYLPLTKTGGNGLMLGSVEWLINDPNWSYRLVASKNSVRPSILASTFVLVSSLRQYSNSYLSWDLLSLTRVVLYSHTKSPCSKSELVMTPRPIRRYRHIPRHYSCLPFPGMKTTERSAPVSVCRWFITLSFCVITFLDGIMFNV